MAAQDPSSAEPAEPNDIDLITLRHLDELSAFSLVWWLQRPEVAHTLSEALAQEPREVVTPLMEALNEASGQSASEFAGYSVTVESDHRQVLSGSFVQGGVGKLCWSVRVYHDAAVGRARAARVERGENSEWAVRLRMAKGTIRVRYQGQDVDDLHSICRLAAGLNFHAWIDDWQVEPHADDVRQFAELGIDVVLEPEGPITTALRETYWARHFSTNLLAKMANQLRWHVTAALFQFHKSQGHDLDFLDRFILYGFTTVFSCEPDQTNIARYNLPVSVEFPPLFHKLFTGQILDGATTSSRQPDQENLHWTMRDIELVTRAPEPRPGDGPFPAPDTFHPSLRDIMVAEGAAVQATELAETRCEKLWFGLLFADRRLLGSHKLVLKKHRDIRWERLYQSPTVRLSTQVCLLAEFHPLFVNVHAMHVGTHVYLNSRYFGIDQQQEFEGGYERIAVWWAQPESVPRRYEDGGITAPGPSTPIEWLVLMTLFAPDTFTVLKHCDALWRSSPFRAHPSFTETFPDAATCFRILKVFDDLDLSRSDFRRDLIFCERLNLPELFHAARPAGAARAPADAVLLVATVVEHGPDADEPCE